MNTKAPNWTNWKSLPNPSKSYDSFRSLIMKTVRNPSYPGVYQLKNNDTGEYVLFGVGVKVGERMCSLIPKEHGGVGRRNNHYKRDYVWKNIDYIQFRTITTETRNEALEIERFLKHQNIHIFNT
tara:strand:+ start:1087 stop:1461 length:375 start_codon:yes stop_codon:yes gene_type:complete